MAFLSGVLVVFSRFQKKLQGDHVTRIDLEEETANVLASLNKLKETTLFGGWVYCL